MSHKYLTRKYLAVAFCVMGFGAQWDELARNHEFYPVPWGRLLAGAGSGLLLPGGIVAILIRDMTGISVSLTVCVWLSLAFWFFPVARLRRWFGMHDPFEEGKSRHQLLVGGVAHVLDAVNKRLFGRQKSGGWS